MGQGFLRVNVVDQDGLAPIQGAHVALRDINNKILYDQVTDATGTVPLMTLPAPDISTTLDPNFPGIPFSVYNMAVSAPNFHTTIYHGIEIFDTKTARATGILRRATPEEIASSDIVQHVVITGTRRAEMQGGIPVLGAQAGETVG